MYIRSQIIIIDSDLILFVGISVNIAFNVLLSIMHLCCCVYDVERFDYNIVPFNVTVALGFGCCTHMHIKYSIE